MLGLEHARPAEAVCCGRKEVEGLREVEEYGCQERGLSQAK